MTRSLLPRSAIVIVVFLRLGCSVDAHAETEESTNQLREDVIECEDAVARLAECCPDFHAQPLGCTFYFQRSIGCSTGESSEQITPVLSQLESRCIRHMSCEAMRSNGVCTRAQEARELRVVTVPSSSGSSNGSGAPTTTTTGSHPPVCP